MVSNFEEQTFYDLTYPQKSIILTDQFYDNEHISVIFLFLMMQ